MPNQLTSTELNSSASPLVIRNAHPKDINSLAEVLIDSFHPPQGLIMSLAYPLLKLGIYEDLRNRLQSCSPNCICLVASTPSSVADSDELIVGTAEISIRSTFSWPTIWVQYPYIANLAIRPSYRRQGIARKLLISCEQTALQWGFNHISLHVLEDNLQARELYFSSGYRLARIESDLSSWVFKRPRRLLLHKQELTS
ncbi:MAG: GNAT family N-acetyltransferase [Moorea sp. SIO2B7]|nr:GNAT family N-acetyltransferase [Moorena sp. SIO2B7]